MPVYRSKFEADVARDLARRQHKAGWQTIRYESESLDYLVPAVYTPDWTLVTATGRVIYIEAKGYFSPTDRRKMLAVQRANPDADIRFVFMRANTRLSKTSKQTYAAWAEKHGFPWAEGRVPDEWAKE